MSQFMLFKLVLTLPRSIRDYISTFFWVTCNCGNHHRHTDAYTYLKLIARRHLSQWYPHMYIQPPHRSPPSLPPCSTPTIKLEVSISECTRRNLNKTYRNKPRNDRKHHKRQLDQERREKEAQNPMLRPPSSYGFYDSNIEKLLIVGGSDEECEDREAPSYCRVCFERYCLYTYRFRYCYN